MTVPPPDVDDLDVTDEDVDPRPHDDLVAAIMEVRSCSRPDAADWVERAGREYAERVVRARWL